jgi:hypothetical protein
VSRAATGDATTTTQGVTPSARGFVTLSTAVSTNPSIRARSAVIAYWLVALFAKSCGDLPLNVMFLVFLMVALAWSPRFWSFFKTGIICPAQGKPALRNEEKRRIKMPP